MKKIIIGMGNPLVSDDGVGIRVIRSLRERLNGRGDVDVVELYAGGIRLMETMVGYKKAIIVDDMLTGRDKPGTIYSFLPSELTTTRNIVSTHDTNLCTALEIGRLLELPLPDEIMIWGIEAEDVSTLGEGLTPAVAEAVPIVVEKILQDLAK